MNVYADRLLNVAKALRESPNPTQFTMDWFGSACGTPQCALGHYACRTDLQDVIYLSKSGDIYAHNWPIRVGIDSGLVLQHFDIKSGEARELFGAYGCEDADTAEEAANYIEGFVKRKYQDESQASLTLGDPT